VVLNLLIIEFALAIEVGVEFSATAVQIAPGQPEYQREMYVGRDVVRTDSVRNNTRLIEIVNTKEQVRLFLVPKEKIYMQQTGSAPVIQEVPDTSAPANPCAGMKDTSCKMLGKETINNRQAEKWGFVLEQGNQVSLSLHWIDVEHRIIVREYLPNGSFMELSPLGAEKVNGRHAEKWLWQLTGPDGQTKTALQWYDPELKISIREETQDGYVRELRDIKTGAQDKELFEIPDGYRQVENLQNYLPQPLARPGQQ